MCLEIYELDLLESLSAPPLAWQEAIKKTIEKANNKYMKGYNKNKESSYLKYWDVNNFYGWATSQKLHVNNFKWVEDISRFDENFIKVIIKKMMNNISLKWIFNTRKIYTKPKTIWEDEDWKSRNACR